MAADDAPDAPQVERSPLQRPGGGAGPSLAERAAARLRDALYATPLHALRLKGGQPLKLLAVPADPLPGDAALGERVAAGRLIHAGHTVLVRGLDFADPALPAGWAGWAHRWGWLRHLAAAVPVPLADKAVAARQAEALARQWLLAFPKFHPLAWRADVLGGRVLAALAHAPLLMSGADPVWRSTMLGALATWARHLDRAAFRLPEGLARLEALAGLYAAGVLMPGGEKRAARALAGLEKLLAALVLPDGGLPSRSPHDMLRAISLLQAAAAAPEALGERAPPLFADALARLGPALRCLMLGDGQLGAWHGAAMVPAPVLDRLARSLATGTETARGGRYSGFYRLSAAGTVVVVDAGPPPATRASSHGHASTLAFEMSDGPVRLISNCGGGQGLANPLSPALLAGLKTSAAHSTLVVDDTNSTRIGDDGQLAAGVDSVARDVRSNASGHYLEASHDGYAKRLGLTVTRRLFLAADGHELAGEDEVAPAPGRRRKRGDWPLAVRFHLGPGVTATPTADGAGALLKLPGGKVWALKAEAASLSIEPSLMVDADGRSISTQQLVLNARTVNGAATIGWRLRRAGK